MAVQEHNIVSGKKWGAAGKEYEEISRQIADSIQHAVDRLTPQPGEEILDLATGTGWTARVVAASGANTTGVDIAEEKISAARELSPNTIDFHVGDAEALPFEDGSFDAVISTCGIQFVTNPEDAISELTRVLRPGGRFVATLWTIESSVAEMFKVFKKYMPSPQDLRQAPPSPFLWGTRERIVELFSQDFEFGVETGVSYYRTTDAEDAWRAFSNSYGPSKSLAASLDAGQRESLKADFITLYKNYQTEIGILCPREYFLVYAKKK